MGCRRSGASEVRHHRHARGDGKDARVGSLRRGEHLPRLHRLAQPAPPERGACQDRHNRVRHLRLRGDRQNLRRARQPDAQRPPQPRRHDIARDTRRRSPGAQGELRGREGRRAAEGDLPRAVAQDAFLHDHREGLPASPHRRLAHAGGGSGYGRGPGKGASRDVDRRRASS